MGFDSHAIQLCFYRWGDTGILLLQFLGQSPRESRPKRATDCTIEVQGPLNGGGFQTGGFPDLDLSFLFVLFCPFWDFPNFSGIFLICSGMVRGFSRFLLFLFLSLLRAPTRNSPERVRDTIWTFPEKSGKPPSLETPRFSFSQEVCGPNCDGFLKCLSPSKFRESIFGAPNLAKQTLSRKCMLHAKFLQNPSFPEILGSRNLSRT